MILSSCAGWPINSFFFFISLSTSTYMTLHFKPVEFHHAHHPDAQKLLTSSSHFLTTTLHTHTHTHTSSHSGKLWQVDWGGVYQWCPRDKALVPSTLILQTTFKNLVLSYLYTTNRPSNSDLWITSSVHQSRVSFTTLLALLTRQQLSNCYSKISPENQVQQPSIYIYAYFFFFLFFFSLLHFLALTSPISTEARPGRRIMIHNTLPTT